MSDHYDGGKTYSWSGSFSFGTGQILAVVGIVFALAAIALAH